MDTLTFLPCGEREFELKVSRIMRWERTSLFQHKYILKKNTNPSKLGETGNINLPIANATLLCKEKQIKFVSFIAMMFQSMQFGIGCGTALGLGNTSLLIIHNYFRSKT